jgi:hypothetical protein
MNVLHLAACNRTAVAAPPVPTVGLGPHHGMLLCAVFNGPLVTMQLAVLSICSYAGMLLTTALPRRCFFAAVCSGSPNGPCAGTGKCLCFVTKQGASCGASNMHAFPPSLDVSRLGSGGGCGDNKCNAVAAKMGQSAACCPHPCG